MKLSKRLATIASYVPSLKNVIDVGCDHALLDIYLVSTRETIHVIASDISAHAIACAKKSAASYELGNRLSFMRTDGCKNIPIQKEDVLVIAGMGARLMMQIIKEAPLLCDTLVLSAHTSVPFVRETMVSLGYLIDKEEVLFDKKWYCIIRFVKGHVSYTEEDILLGPYAKENEEYIQYLYQKEKKIAKICGQKSNVLLYLEKRI